MQKNIWQITTTKLEPILFTVLLVVSFLPRFLQLGYSHFYGDETKTFYLDKTVTAFDFFMSQRKGPVQFLVVWVMEKLSPTFDPFIIRLPFALAGFLSVIALYFFVKLLFDNYKLAFISAFLFSINGFFIAFSRTVQYQSFLLLFGFISLCFVLLYLRKSQLYLLLLAGLFMGLAFLTHYDALNFLAVSLYLFISSKRYKESAIFISVALLLPAIFYIPYLLGGYFELNTLNYLAKRISGQGYKSNSSLYTFYIYNPSVIWLGAIAVSFLSVKKNKLLTLWLLFSFALYELIFKNPGTHILNYFIPLIILCAYSLLRVNKYLLGVVFVYLFGLSMYLYVPLFNANYPWQSKILTRDYQVFIYGFPYNREWPQIAQTLKAFGARSYYTNDNTVIAKYYVGDLPVTPPGTNYLPPYFVNVIANQEISMNADIYPGKYTLLQDIYAKDQLVAQIYRLK